MVGQSQDRLQPGEAPWTVTTTQALEPLDPPCVQPHEPVVNGRAHADAVFQIQLDRAAGVAIHYRREEGAPEAVVCPDQPQDEIWVVRAAERAEGFREPHGPSLVPRAIGTPGSATRFP